MRKKTPTPVSESGVSSADIMLKLKHSPRDGMVCCIEGHRLKVEHLCRQFQWRTTKSCPVGVYHAVGHKSVSPVVAEPVRYRAYAERYFYWGRRVVFSRATRRETVAYLLLEKRRRWRVFLPSTVPVYRVSTFVILTRVASAKRNKVTLFTCTKVRSILTIKRRLKLSRECFHLVVLHVSTILHHHRVFENLAPRRRPLERPVL